MKLPTAENNLLHNHGALRRTLNVVLENTDHRVKTDADRFGHTGASLQALNRGINPDYWMNQQYQFPAQTCAKYFIYHGLLSPDVTIGTYPC